MRSPVTAGEPENSQALQKIMSQKRSKRYRAAAEQVDRKKAYSLPDAVSTLKKFPPTKFDQTVTVSFRLGVDPKQSDQMVRGTCALPHGSGKNVRVLVFAEGAAAKAATEAGAEHVGFKELIQKVLAFRDERDWKKYHNEKDIAISISLEANELLENFQWKTSEEAVAQSKDNIKVLVKNIHIEGKEGVY